MKLSAEYLRERLDYDPETGVFTWRPKPERTQYDKTWNTKYAGTAAGATPSSYGYGRVAVDNVNYQAHRLAWMWMEGEWPEGEIDHKDRNRINNRWGNLRLANPTQNRANRSLSGRNTSGAKGVTWHRQAEKWMAQIEAGGVHRYLGLFVDKEEAARAYMRAAKKHFGEFATDGA